ncbi:tektin-1 [Pholidichthys leucotaenia]
MSVLETSALQGDGLNLTNVAVLPSNSKLFRAECIELITEAKKTCKRMQDAHNRRLDQRAKDVEFLKKELELKLEEIILEIDELISLQRRVVKAVEVISEPMRVTLMCLEEREKCLATERTHDEVDRELLKERDVIERVSLILHDVGKQIIEQIRLNRSVKYHLEKDLKEKFEAQAIDNSCALMIAHSTSTLQQMKNKSTGLASLGVTPNQWENFSDINIAKAEKQKTDSLSLRALVESLLEQTAADLQKQIQVTTAAFQVNIRKFKSSKGQMEEKLPEIQAEITSQQRIREDLQAAIKENEYLLNLTKARLGLRFQRPGKEHCHDPVQSQFLSEVQQLSSHISKLHEAVERSEQQQRELVRCQLELQGNIEVKNKSLYIDEVLCIQHREPILIHHF